MGVKFCLWDYLKKYPGMRWWLRDDVLSDGRENSIQRRYKSNVENRLVQVVETCDKKDK